MNTKICTKCGIEKNIDEFGVKKQYGKDYRRTHCNDCRRNYQREYNKINREKINEKNRNYMRTHKEERKKYYEENKEHFKEKAKIYRSINKEHYKKLRREYERNRRRNDKIYKLKVQTGKMLWSSFNRKCFKKRKQVEEILGCPLETFVDYLLQTFKKNYGHEWNKIEQVDIDHIYPLKYATTEEEIIRLCHYKNLQLLKHKDNLEKRARLDWELGD